MAGFGTSRLLMDEASPTVAAAPTGRLVFLDRLRTLAQIDIIANHAMGRHLFGGIGLPVFLITSVAMVVRRPVPPLLREVAPKRTRAILLPWLFWSAAYVPFLLWREWRNGRAASDLFEPAMLMYGTVIHLWFLPFILVANLATLGAARLTLRLPVRRVIWGSAILGALTLTVCSYLRLHLPVPVPVSGWLFSIACVPLGLALGRSLSLGPERWRSLVGLALLGTGLALAGHFGSPAILYEWALLKRFGMALGLTALAAMWAGRGDVVTQVLVRNSFGIYLVHPMILMVAGEYGIQAESLLVGTLLAWFASLVFVLILRQTSLARVV